MDPDNLDDLYDAVVAWQRATRELRGHLTEVYHAEGYHLEHDKVIGEAVILRCLNAHLEVAQDVTAASVLELLRRQPTA